ncbi:hypothetical protein KJ596_01110 [Patescibacteria group bacterium]|nr:hypothetical protein [Patescibacteria group bacterium]MBU1868118.1 hypothetical protein [Patescibacteria group bacterium]
MDKSGILMCAKYAASPNFFGYCGPAQNSSVLDHLKESRGDLELGNILSQFETLYPYLRLISQENRIDDPFDKRVVEAYWVGNQLLEKVTNIKYWRFLNELLLLRKRMGQFEYNKTGSKIASYTLLPHHSFHVFNIFKRTGKDPSYHTLNTMDNCRISWGQLIENKLTSLLVRTHPLVFENQQLKLGAATAREVELGYKGKGFLDKLKVGDKISYHWGHACDHISQRQMKNLHYYTQRSIDYFNSPLA